MLPKSEIRSKSREGCGNEKLLREIEAINSAIYSKSRLSVSVSTSSSRSKSIGKGQFGDEKVQRGVGKEEGLTREKKPSFWNWKPLKAFSHIRNRRFNCRFSLHVHGIEGLPSCFEHSKLSVHWKRRDGEMETKAFVVVEGRVEVDEKLTHVCSVYGSSNGLHHSAKYEAKHFLVYPVIAGVPLLDLGKHRVDLTRLLPLTLEDLGAEKSTGKWSTSFKLIGKGKGATLNVSFGYTVLGDNPTASSPLTSSPESQKFKQKFSNMEKPITNFNRGVRKSTTKAEKTTGVIQLAQATPFLKSGLSDPVKVLYEKRDDGDELSTPVYPTPDLDENSKEKSEESGVCSELTVVEEGKERSSEISVSIEDSDGREITAMGEEKESPLSEIQSALHDMSNFDLCYPNSPVFEGGVKGSSFSKSQSLDEAAESVECDFLDMMGIENQSTSESEPESPRERLLRQFEKESLANGYNMFDFGIYDEDYAAESEYASSVLHKSGDFGEADGSKLHKLTKAEMIEGLEAEMLMNEWGFSEEVFESSPTEKSGGFGSPIDSYADEPFDPPHLGHGLGPFVKTSNGGFLRSMNTALFSGSSLIMQASRPVVVPAEMGSGVTEILQRLASSGIEKLSLQANQLMPLEDITGSTMQKIAWEVMPTPPAPEVRSLKSRGEVGTLHKSMYPNRRDIDSEYVSLEELAPLAMDKIEALSMEGLRIQSGLSDENAAHITGETDQHSPPISLDGITGVRLLNVREGVGQSGCADGLMGLSLTLDEWARLDSGQIDEEMSEKTSKILAAHHADRARLTGGGGNTGKRWGGGGGRRTGCGILGDNFTVALMVQLRDPLRDYEPVGVPMLALIQVERAFVGPKAKIYSMSSERQEVEEEKEEEKEEEGGALFRVGEVHMAGMEEEAAGRKREMWGSRAQQQSGSRWLVANGMGKGGKQGFVKTVVGSRGVKQEKKQVGGGSLWSISAKVVAEKWKGLAALNPYRRNTNVVFPG